MNSGSTTHFLRCGLCLSLFLYVQSSPSSFAQGNSTAHVVQAPTDLPVIAERSLSLNGGQVHSFTASRATGTFHYLDGRSESKSYQLNYYADFNSGKGIAFPLATTVDLLGSNLLLTQGTDTGSSYKEDWTRWYNVYSFENELELLGAFNLPFDIQLHSLPSGSLLLERVFEEGTDLALISPDGTFDRAIRLPGFLHWNNIQPFADGDILVGNHGKVVRLNEALEPIYQRTYSGMGASFYPSSYRNSRDGSEWLAHNLDLNLSGVIDKETGALRFLAVAPFPDPSELEVPLNLDSYNARLVDIDKDYLLIPAFPRRLILVNRSTGEAEREISIDDPLIPFSTKFQDAFSSGDASYLTLSTNPGLFVKVEGTLLDQLQLVSLDRGIKIAVPKTPSDPVPISWKEPGKHFVSTLNKGFAEGNLSTVFSKPAVIDREPDLQILSVEEMDEPADFGITQLDEFSALTVAIAATDLEATPAPVETTAESFPPVFQPQLSIRQTSSRHLELRFELKPGESYHLEHAPSLDGPFRWAGSGGGSSTETKLLTHRMSSDDSAVKTSFWRLRVFR